MNLHDILQVEQLYLSQYFENKASVKTYKNGLKHGLHLYWVKMDGHSPVICPDSYVHSYTEPGMYIENENDTYINYAELCDLADPKNFYEFPEHLMLDFFSSNVLPPFLQDANINQIRTDVEINNIVKALSNNPMDLEIANFKKQYPNGVLSKLESYNKGVMTYGEKYLDPISKESTVTIHAETVDKAKNIKLPETGLLINIVGDYSMKSEGSQTNTLSYIKRNNKKYFFNNNYDKLLANRILSNEKNKRVLDCRVVILAEENVFICNQDIISNGENSFAHQIKNIDAEVKWGEQPSGELRALILKQRLEGGGSSDAHQTIVFNGGRDDSKGSLKIIKSSYNLKSVFYNSLVERDIPRFIPELSFNDNKRRNINIMLYYHDLRESESVKANAHVKFTNRKIDSNGNEEIAVIINNKADIYTSPIKLLINKAQNKYKARRNNKTKHKISKNCSILKSDENTFYRKYEMESGRTMWRADDDELSEAMRRISMKFAPVISNNAYQSFKIEGNIYKHRKDHSRADVTKDEVTSGLVNGVFKEVENIKFGRFGCEIVNKKKESQVNIKDDNDFMNDLFGDI